MKKAIELVPALRDHIERKYRTQSAAARAWGLSCGFVSMVLKEERLPSKAMLDDVGLEAVVPKVHYVRKSKSEEL